MALTVTEANAVNRLLHFVGIPDPHSDRRGPVADDQALEAAMVLAKSAHRRLMAGLTHIDVSDGWGRVHELRQACESDGAAQAVCRALAAHAAHGGSIPWPSITRPLDEWRAAHEAATS